MRIIIDVVDDKVIVEIDQKPSAIKQTLLPKPIVREHQSPNWPPPLKPEEYEPQMDPKCRYCIRRGNACVRHGGESSGIYTAKKHRAKVMSQDVAPTDREEVEQMMNDKRAYFDDPWDCQMCRNAGDLCDMHERMTKRGKKPPVLEHLKPSPHVEVRR